MAALLAPTITNIYLVRSDHQLTQAEFAERLGVDGSYISKIENGEVIPSDALLERVFSEFSVLEKYGKSAIWLIKPYERRYLWGKKA